MAGYIQKTLIKFQHPTPQNLEDSTLKVYPKEYGEKAQFTKEEDGTPELSAASIRILQQRIGILLFYGRSVDMTLMVALSTLASGQGYGIETMARAMILLSNYCATHPEPVIRYKKSDIIIEIQSDASYLYNPKVHSRAGRHFFLMDNPKRGQPIMINGSVHVVYTIIRNVMSLAA